MLDETLVHVQAALQAESEGLASVAKGDFSAIAVASTFDSGVMGVWPS